MFLNLLEFNKNIYAKVEKYQYKMFDFLFAHFYIFLRTVCTISLQK